MIETTAAKLEFIDAPPAQAQESLLDAVLHGLSHSPKTLPCRFFYDSVGSELFERICRLQEYYLTRTEQRILECYAPEIIEAAGREIEMVEFGSGSSCKTRILLNAVLDRQAHLRYLPIDISGDFLRASCAMLVGEYDGLSVTGIAAEYAQGIALLPESDAPRLFLFLGSNIGNFDPEEAIAFLSRIRGRMGSDDRILVGYDLAKERSIVEAAYNDAEGVTAAFNKNLLARINHELGGDFDLNQFDHHAPLLDTPSRIEMRLISRRRQVVSIQGMNRSFTFERGEYIHTENSYKYTPAHFESICARSGLSIRREWRDERGWFAVTLLEPTGA